MSTPQPEVEELFRSRRGGTNLTSPDEIILQVSGIEVADGDAAEAKTAAASFLATEFADGYDGKELENIDVERIGPDDFIATATYKRAEQIEKQHEVGDSTYSFDTTRGSIHITQSKATVWSGTTDPDTPAPSFDGAINVTDDSVDGCDAPGPGDMKVTVNLYMTAEEALDYELVLRGFNHNVNSAEIELKGRLYQPGEVLLLGGKGQERGSGTNWEISLEFAISFNATNLRVGSILVPSKRGWDFLWCRYGDVAGGGAEETALEAAYTPATGSPFYLPEGQFGHDDGHSHSWSDHDVYTTESAGTGMTLFFDGNDWVICPTDSINFEFPPHAQSIADKYKCSGSTIKRTFSGQGKWSGASIGITSEDKMPGNRFTEVVALAEWGNPHKVYESGEMLLFNDRSNWYICLTRDVDFDDPPDLNTPTNGWKRSGTSDPPVGTFAGQGTHATSSIAISAAAKPTKKSIVKRPIAAYVEQIFEYADFSDLDLPTEAE